MKLGEEILIKVRFIQQSYAEKDYACFDAGFGVPCFWTSKKITIKPNRVFEINKKKYKLVEIKS